MRRADFLRSALALPLLGSPSDKGPTDNWEWSDIWDMPKSKISECEERFGCVGMWQNAYQFPFVVPLHFKFAAKRFERRFGIGCGLDRYIKNDLTVLYDGHGDSVGARAIAEQLMRRMAMEEEAYLLADGASRAEIEELTHPRIVADYRQWIPYSHA